MMTLAEASDHVRSKVIYRPPHVPREASGEEGIITSVNTSYVFVRYGADVGSMATPPDRIELVAVDA